MVKLHNGVLTLHQEIKIMPGFQTPITIKQALLNIQDYRYLLPAFQREYVWKAPQVEMLFDSLMKGYPISSMLFWKVTKKAKSQYRFYKMLDRYVESKHTHNEEFNTSLKEEFYAILDGQQRLTSLNIGLRGSYAYHKHYARYDHSENNYPTRHLYLDISKEYHEDENGQTYKFLFIDKAVSEERILFEDKSGKWFLCGHVLQFDESYDVSDFATDHSLSRDERKMIERLHDVITNRPSINFYEEDTDNPDVAVNIFTRINSGGTVLNYADILLSIAIASWKKKDARTEIHKLVDDVNDKGFNISHEYILKAFLYLEHKDVRFRVRSFDNGFIDGIEDKWETIRDSVLELFTLIKRFGFGRSTLTSNNATLPILHYIYHKGHRNFASSIAAKEDRGIIKKWLLKTLLLRTFGTTADRQLQNSRRALGQSALLELFPAKRIEEELAQPRILQQDFIDALLATQKDNRYAFSILALLYNDMDYSQNFDLDHIFPSALWDESISDWRTYNSIVNLQMLESSENRSKQDEPAEKWIERMTKNRDRATFLASRLLPDTNYSPTNFSEFVRLRTIILTQKIQDFFKGYSIN